MGVRAILLLRRVPDDMGALSATEDQMTGGIMHKSPRSPVTALQ